MPRASSARQRLWRRSDVCFQLHPHRIWQANKSYLERGDVFGLISHENSLLSGTDAHGGNSLQLLNAVCETKSWARCGGSLVLLRSSCVRIAPFTYVAAGRGFSVKCAARTPQTLDIAIHRPPLSDVQSLKIVFTDKTPLAEDCCSCTQSISNASHMEVVQKASISRCAATNSTLMRPRYLANLGLADLQRTGRSRSV